MFKRKIFDRDLEKIKNLYYKDKKSMREIAEKLGVSINAVVYFMRRKSLKCRSFSDANAVRFEKKKPSFEVRANFSDDDKKLRLAGVMLYWAEGYKSDKAGGVDFTNSDPNMIKIFMNFLRSSYIIDERRLRVLLYCYSNQGVDYLKKFWSGLTSIPLNQFIKPYVRESDGNKRGREMQKGMVHIRYNDKKLLNHIRGLMEEYKILLGR